MEFPPLIFGFRNMKILKFDLVDFSCSFNKIQRKLYSQCVDAVIHLTFNAFLEFAKKSGDKIQLKKTDQIMSLGFVSLGTSKLSNSGYVYFKICACQHFDDTNIDLWGNIRFMSWEEGASLTLVDHPSDDCVTIKTPYWSLPLSQ